MSADFNAAEDFAAAADGLELVTVERPGSPAPGAVCRALRRGVTAREARASEGRYTADDVAWHLTAPQPGAPPRPGDVLADAAGRRFTVLSVTRSAMTGRVRCVARDLAIAHGLDAFIDVERAEYVKGESGAETAVWRPWRTGVRARIQPAGAEVRPENDLAATRAACRVFVSEAMELDHRHRVRGPDGAVYRITGVRAPERIDALLEIEALRET